jgi:hypothetical protein
MLRLQVPIFHYSGRLIRRFGHFPVLYFALGCYGARFLSYSV